METPFQTTRDLWTYLDEEILGADVRRGVDLVGFRVEAVDGRIGTVHEATYAPARSYVVVDTGPWLPDEKVMLPAGIIDCVDVETKTAYVDRTKDEIEGAPTFDNGRFIDEAFMALVGGYYGGIGGRPR